MAATTAAVVGGVSSAASAASSMSGGGGGMPKWQRKQAKQISQDGERVAAGMRVAGFNPDQTAAQQAIRDSQGFLDADSAGAQATAADLAKGINAQDIRAMYNPYEQDVVNSFMADLEHMRAQNGLVTDDLAQKAGAFGGDRSAVYSAVSNGELDRNAMSQIADLRYSGYNTAGQMALSNHGLKLGGNAQLQDIINSRRANRYQDIGALYQSGNDQQAQTQREYDLPQDRIRFRMEANGTPLPTGAPGGDQVGAAMAGYQDGYNAVGGLLGGWGNSRSVYPGGGAPMVNQPNVGNAYVSPGSGWYVPPPPPVG